MHRHAWWLHVFWVRENKRKDELEARCDGYHGSNLNNKQTNVNDLNVLSLSTRVRDLDQKGQYHHKSKNDALIFVLNAFVDCSLVIEQPHL